MRGVWLVVTAVALAAAVVACKDGGGLGPGEQCFSSSECMPGLVCDFGQSPAVCSSNLTPMPDAAVDEPDAPVDEPDAPPGTPDAAPPPDAPPAMPDAPPAMPDAGVPDAGVPDAGIDAAT